MKPPLPFITTLLRGLMERNFPLFDRIEELGGMWWHPDSIPINLPTSLDFCPPPYIST
jgi:hypothetical protein